MYSNVNLAEKLVGNIFNIQHFSIGDGPGIRTTVFFKGCNLRCAWCHNPESQSAKAEWMFYKEKCTGCGRCAALTEKDTDFVCFQDARQICGKKYTADEILSEVIKDKSFYENSGGGATFSGGECLLQIEFLTEILKACKENGIHTAVDTAGHVPYETIEKILPYTDLFLYDVKCYDSEKHKQYTGVGNELILENLRRLLNTGVPVWVRIPIIPTVNDTVEEMQNIKLLLDSYGAPETVELLPYHAIGEHKYDALNKKAHTFSVPSEEKMAQLKKVFS